MTTQVVTANLTSPVRFQYDCESGATAGQRWPKWCKEFERYVKGSGITDDEQKMNMLLYTAGPDVCDIYDTLSKTTDKYAEE